MFPITISVTINSATELVKLQALTALAVDTNSVPMTATEVNARNAVTALAVGLGADTPVKVEDKPAKKPAKTEAPAQAVGTQPTATGEAVAAPESQAEAPAAIDYPTLQKAVFALAGKSRDAASAVAASFGVKTFKELPADKWADALAAVNAKIAELGA